LRKGIPARGTGKRSNGKGHQKRKRHRKYLVGGAYWVVGFFLSGKRMEKKRGESLKGILLIVSYDRPKPKPKSEKVGGQLDWKRAEKRSGPRTRDRLRASFRVGQSQGGGNREGNTSKKKL